MTEYIGDKVISGITKATKYNAHTLLDFKWSDHILNDISWLRADTFSWQNGNTYTAVYNYLVNSIQGATETTDQGITFYECTNGMRIALADQENTIQSVYSTTDVAWYYILDTDNTRFKLPRTKYGFVGLRDEVGKFVDESLPNIKGSFTLWKAYLTDGQPTSGAFQKMSGSQAYTRGEENTTPYNGFTFDASRSSSTYQDNASVQQKSTQMYLYFYVGEFAQTAIEQTAGITSEQLNAKQDVCVHIIEEYVNGTSGYRIWSSGYCEQWGSSTDTTTSGTTVQLLKSYISTDYQIYVSPIYGAAYYTTSYGSDNKTINSFKVYSTDTPRPAYWKVSGYLAEGQY